MISALITAAILNFLASGMHLAIIFIGPEGYRRFRAGETLAKQAEENHYWPPLLTGIISAALIIWGLYCLSLAGLIVKLPYSYHIVGLITGVYLLRAIYPLLLSPWVALFRTRFMLVSSGICGIFGLIHLVGIIL